jgi:hypothetical protein
MDLSYTVVTTQLQDTFFAEVNDEEYLFFEWKSGDYTLRGRDPK